MASMEHLLCVPTVPRAPQDPGLSFTPFSDEETQVTAPGHAQKEGEVPGDAPWAGPGRPPLTPKAVSPTLSQRAGLGGRAAPPHLQPPNPCCSSGLPVSLDRWALSPHSPPHTPGGFATTSRPT